MTPLEEDREVWGPVLTPWWARIDGQGAGLPYALPRFSDGRSPGQF